MNAITFRNYPIGTNRVPGVYAEVDPSQANTGQVNQRTLLIGQKLSAGAATAGVPYLFSSLTDAQAAFGNGSQLAIMAQRYRAIDSFGEVWFLPLADDGGSVKATGTLTITGPATAAGTFNLYVAGTLVPVLVSSGDTATAIATNIKNAVNAQNMLPVTAGNSAGVITFTANNGGLAGNDIDLRANYLGAPYESLPAGVGATFVAMSGGTTNPSAGLTTALANIAGLVSYDFIGMAYNDTACLNAIGAYLNDTTGTWSWQQELFGHCFVGHSAASLSAATTVGLARDDQHVTIISSQGSPSPSWYWAVDLTAACAVSLRAHPAVPLQGLALNVLAPPIATRWNISERNTLLYDGISTYKVNQQGTVLTDRVITTWQTNAAGVPDNSYLDVETMSTLTFGIRNVRIELASKFQRMILVSDGTRIPPGSAMTTASIIKLAAVARYRVLCTGGYMQNADQFAQQAVGENQGNGVVALLLPFQLANQLRIVAMLVAFTKP